MSLKLYKYLFLSRNHLYARTSKKTASRLKTKILLILLFTSLITTLPMLRFTEVGAVNTYNAATSSIDWQIKSKIYYEAIRDCMTSSALSDFTYLSKDNINNGKWFGKFYHEDDRTTSVGVYVRDDIISNASGMNDKDWYASWIRDKDDWDGMTQCKNSALIKSALNTWGISAIEILCNSGLIRKTIYKEQSVPECVSNSSYDLEGLSNKTSMDPVAFSTYIKEVVYGIIDGTEPQIPGAGDITTSAGAPWYRFYKYTLDQSCIRGIDTNDGSGSILKSDEKLNYRDVSLIQPVTNKIVSVMFGGTLNNDNDTNIGPITTPESYISGSSKPTMLKCKDIVLEMNKYASSYVLKLTAIAEGKESSESIKDIPKADDLTGTSTSTCTIPSVGWILCPIINTMGSIIDASWGLISNMLKTDVSIVNSGTSANPNPAFSAWKIMQGIANVAFVIAFLIIIFSQVTSIGVTNYGIKKLLPRLIIAAILVNVSFYICQIAVDLSNILGSSLKGVFDGLATTVYKPEFTGNTANAGGIIAGVIGGVAGVAVLWASVGTLIPVLLAGIVAIVMILFILIARQALIILLIVISPLAFVAYLLPNTEKLFQKWQKAFTSMLLVYPIIAIVIGGSSFAATILKDVLVDPANPNSNIIASIGAAAVAILPLFIVPGLLKKSLDSVGSIGGKISGFGDKLSKGAGDKTKNTRFIKNMQEEKTRKTALIQSGQYKGNNPFQKLRSGAHGKFNNSRISGIYGDKEAVRGISLEKKIEDEQVGNTELLLRNNSSPEKLVENTQKTLNDALVSGDKVKVRAANKILLSSGSAGVTAAANAVHSAESTLQLGAGGTMNKTQQIAFNSFKNDINTANLKSKDISLAKYAIGTSTLGAVVINPATYSSLSNEEFSTQTLQSLQTAEGNGGLTRTKAREIQGNLRLMEKMGEKEKEIINNVAV